jgi:hypothetical protein
MKALTKKTFDLSHIVIFLPRHRVWIPGRASQSSQRVIAHAVE